MKQKYKLKDSYEAARDYIILNSLPEPNSGCWIWMKGIDSGYGICGRIFRGKQVLRSHQLSLIAFNEISPFLVSRKRFVCHKCHTKSCVNPSHLYLGTPQQNSNDEKARGNLYWRKKTHCPRGHEYNTKNTYTRTDKHGHTRRACRKCDNIKKQIRKSRRDS